MHKFILNNNLTYIIRKQKNKRKGKIWNDEKNISLIE